MQLKVPLSATTRELTNSVRNRLWQNELRSKRELHLASRRRARKLRKKAAKG